MLQLVCANIGLIWARPITNKSINADYMCWAKQGWFYDGGFGRSVSIWYVTRAEVDRIFSDFLWIGTDMNFLWKKFGDWIGFGGKSVPDLIQSESVFRSVPEYLFILGFSLSNSQNPPHPTQLHSSESSPSLTLVECRPTTRVISLRADPRIFR